MRRFLPFAALLGVALVLGCQDLAPVGPDGLEPQFDKPTFNCEDPNPAGHCHEDDAVPQRFTVTVTDATDISGSGVTTPVSGGEIIVDPFTLNFPTFFTSKLTCGNGDIGTTKTGFLFITAGQDHTHLFFSFLHNDAKHSLALLGDKPNTWPPDPGNDVTLTAKNGEWEVSTKGKNHRNGCTGEGGDGIGDPITWTTTILDDL